MAVRESNNMKQWLIFFLSGVVETANSSIQVFKDLINLKYRHEQEVLPYFGTRRQKNAQNLMLHLYQKPLVNIKEVAELLNIQHNTASTLINDFVKHKVLEKLPGKQRNQLFWFQEYMIIFSRQFN